MSRTKLSLMAVSVILLALVAHAQFSAAQTVDPNGPPQTAFACRDGRTPIRQSDIPLNIIRSGASYVVVEPLTGVGASANAISVAADFVTIDLNGFPIVGIPGSGNGIHINNNQIGCRVINGTVSGFDGTGVVADKAPGALVKNVISMNNLVDGFDIDQGGLVTDCVARGNGGAGFRIERSSLGTSIVATMNGTDFLVDATSCTYVTCP